MSYLEKLLDRVEVEWKNLDDLATITIGDFVRKDSQDDTAVYPVYNGGISPTGYYHRFNNTGNKIIISARGANAGFVNRISKPYWAGNSCYSIGIKHTKEINWIFVYYYLKENENKLIGGQQKGGIPAVSKKQMQFFKIPIPCPENPKKSIEIQQKIVDILDTFTEITAELTAELTARKQQFSYYREQLLCFDDNAVEWKKLGEIVLKTSNIKWEKTNNSYRYIDLSSVCREKNVITETIQINKENAPSRAKKIVLKDDVIFATTRPTQQRLCLITDKYTNEVASTGYCVLRANKKEVLPKWIYFWISSNKFKKYLEDNQSGSAYPAISDNKVKDFIIPVPSLKEQDRIVSILDKFDILTTSISEGLPKEIELRQKQYEYYRALLLDFPKENKEV